MKLKVEGEWLTLVQVYAPMNDSRSEVNKHFYNELQKVTVKVGRRDTDSNGCLECKSGHRLCNVGQCDR